MDKDSREALQVAKELTAKFIETRTVSPGNFAEIFPAVYGVVARAIAQSAQSGQSGQAGDEEDARETGTRGGTARKAPRTEEKPAGDRE